MVYGCYGLWLHVSCLHGYIHWLISDEKVIIRLYSKDVENFKMEKMHEYLNCLVFQKEY